MTTKPKPLILLPLLLSLSFSRNFAPSACANDVDTLSSVSKSSRDVIRLFRDEIQDATTKMKWRGERLSEDTIYAAALTGLSWQSAWGKNPLFSMQWGDLKKAEPKGKRRKPQETEKLIASVQQREYNGDAKGAVMLAEANFAPLEIALNPTLKTSVGGALKKMQEPERAFEIYAAPFDPGKKSTNAPELNREFRLTAFDLARRTALRREDNSEEYKRQAIAFALSLLLQPDTENRLLDTELVAYLEREGVDLDRVALGILQAPSGLPGLPQYAYVASDLLLLRATPRLLPYLMHLAQSNDVHIRSRSVVALATVAYQRQRNDAPGWSKKLTSNELREYGLSSGERKMIVQEAMEAVKSDNYRLRMAGAQALGLLGDEKSVALLQKLTKDPAYTLSPQIKGTNVRTIQFPVRAAACAAAFRFDFKWNPGGGTSSGKDLDTQKRGGQDVTNDRRNFRKEMSLPLRITPLDMYEF